MTMTMTNDSDPTSDTATPLQSGFYMPAEFDPHDRCWMMWPSRDCVWDDMQATREAYARVAHAISQFEPVSMLANKRDMAGAKKLLGSDVELIECPIDDSWARDAGPNFLVNDAGDLAAAVWTFNAWGQKYAGFEQDDAAGACIAELADASVFCSQLVAEGGGVTVDGQGTIITTESCFLNPNRNPGWSKREVGEELLATLGGKKVVWLPGNPDEKETDGHVDGLLQYVRPGVVLVEVSYDLNNPWYDIMQDNLQALKQATDADGRTIDWIPIEDAYGAKTRGDHFCLSYVNSYLANGGVVMPMYGCATDERAKAAYQRAFPEREVVQVDIADIAIGGGGIHCITQQQPARRPVS